MHERPGLGQFDHDDLLDLLLRVGEVGVDQHADALRRRPLAQADHHRAVADHEDVAALHGGGLVVIVIVAEPELQVVLEFGVEVPDHAGVQRLALTCLLGHRVHRQSAVDERGVVALEQVVGQRSQHEVGVAQFVPPQAGVLGQVHLTLEDPTNHELGQLTAGHLRGEEALTERLLQLEAGVLRPGHPLEQPLPRFRDVQRLAKEVCVVADVDAPLDHLGHEGVVLLPGDVLPHDVVEEQLLEVARCQPLQLESGTVDDDVLEDAHLRVDVICHMPIPP